jgi:hypothetical protein
MTLALSSPDKFHEGDQYAGRENGRRYSGKPRFVDYTNYGPDDTEKRPKK